MNRFKKSTILFLSLSLCFSLVGCSFSSNKSNKDKSQLTISAAASLKEAMADIQNEFNAINPDVELTFNFGSSGSLQKQIEQGAPCDLFISAGQNQMNALNDENLIINDTRKDLVNNSLVLIGSDNSNIKSVSELTNNNIKHIAMGEPSSVPAGKYADEVLNNLKLNDTLKSKLVYAKDVKEVLSWVVSGNAEAGFVYKSDTTGVDSVKIIETVSEEYHSPINYPAAVIKDSKNVESAKLFEDFLFSDKAKQIFEKYGYSPL